MSDADIFYRLQHVKHMKDLAPIRQKVPTCRCLDFNIVHRLHETWSRHEKGAVAHAPRCGDDLATAPMQSL